MYCSEAKLYALHLSSSYWEDKQQELAHCFPDSHSSVPRKIARVPTHGATPRASRPKVLRQQEMCPNHDPRLPDRLLVPAAIARIKQNGGGQTSIDHNRRTTSAISFLICARRSERSIPDLRSSAAALLSCFSRSWHSKTHKRQRSIGQRNALGM